MVARLTTEETELFDALSTQTTRRILAVLYDHPSTQSEISDRTESSMQNVHYHLEKLEDAGLIEGVDTVYSDKGKEMTIYAPTRDPIIIVGDENETASIQKRVKQVLTPVLLLGVVSAVVQWLIVNFVGSDKSNSGVIAPATPDGELIINGKSIISQLGVFQPGILFFVGGIVTLSLFLLYKN